jgi:hypothetical protein
MQSDGADDSCHIFDATATVPDEFLDAAVISSLLGIESGASTVDGGCGAAGSELVSFHLLNKAAPDAGASAFGAQTPTEFPGHGRLLQSPASCIASPVSNEDGESKSERPAAEAQNNGSGYVFGFGNLPSISVPGTSASSRLVPLVTSGSSAPAGYAAAAKHPAPTAPGGGKDNLLSVDHFLLPSVPEAVDATAMNRASGSPPPDFPLHINNLFNNHDVHPLVSAGTPAPRADAVPPPSNPQAMATLSQSQRSHHTTGPDASLRPLDSDALFSSHHALAGFALGFDGCNQVQMAQGGPDPATTMSFMDMFRIDTVPISQPSDWSGPPAAAEAGCSVVALKHSHRRSEPGKAKKASVGKKKPAGARGAGRAHFSAKAPTGGVEASGSAPPDGPAEGELGHMVNDVIPPRVGGAVVVGTVQPSRFCHICLRRAGRVTLLACGNTVEGSCRKVVCEKCFETFGWDWRAALEPNSMWTCTHCRQA